MLYCGHRNRCLGLFGFAKLILEASLAALHHDVLNQPLLLILRIKEVQKLDHIWSSSELSHDLILSGDDVSCFLGTFDSDSCIFVLIESLKDKAYKDWSFD